MALLKPIELPNGVTVNYHRITSLNIITNEQNVLEISSYTSEAKRKEEQLNLEMGLTSNLFVYTTIFGTPYDQTATVESMYDYLKTLEMFEGSEDV